MPPSFSRTDLLENDKTWLIPKRPRTPLTINRDLVVLVEAQTRPIATHGHQARPHSSSGSLERPVASSGNPALAADEFQEVVTSRRAAQPFQEVGLGPFRTAIDPLEASRRTVANPPEALAWNRAEAIALDVKEVTKVLRPARSTPRSTGKQRKGLRSSRDVPESSTKAREPSATQRLSGDLRLLSNAVAARRKDPRRMKDEYVPPAAPHPNEDPTPKRIPASMWERPWRTPPSKRPSPRRNEKRNSLANVDKSMLANLIASQKNQRKEQADSSEMPPPMLTPKSKAKQANADDVKAKSSANVVPPGANAIPPGSNTSGIGLSDGNLNLWRMAMDLKIPHDVLKHACDIFKEHAIGEENDTPDKSHLMVANTVPTDVMKLSLTKDLFSKVLMTITGATRFDELPAEFFYETFARADKDGSEEIDFVEFAIWYAKYGFSEEVLLTKDQRMMRDVARKFSMPHSEIERFKAKFDEFDLDGSGEIDFSEFEKILAQLLKVPAHLELPASRLKQFWQETDSDGTGTINFEEFLGFYCKRFDAADSDVSPLETFYRGLRPSAVRTPTAIRPFTSPAATPTNPRPQGAEARLRLAVPSFFPKVN